MALRLGLANLPVEPLSAITVSIVDSSFSSATDTSWPTWVWTAIQLGDFSLDPVAWPRCRSPYHKTPRGSAARPERAAPP